MCTLPIIFDSEKNLIAVLVVFGKQLIVPANLDSRTAT